MSDNSASTVDTSVVSTPLPRRAFPVAVAFSLSKEADWSPALPAWSVSVPGASDIPLWIACGGFGGEGVWSGEDAEEGLSINCRL